MFWVTYFRILGSKGYYTSVFELCRLYNNQLRMSVHGLLKSASRWPLHFLDCVFSGVNTRVCGVVVWLHLVTIQAKNK